MVCRQPTRFIHHRLRHWFRGIPHRLSEQQEGRAFHQPLKQRRDLRFHMPRLAPRQVSHRDRHSCRSEAGCWSVIRAREPSASSCRGFRQFVMSAVRHGCPSTQDRATRCFKPLRTASRHSGGICRPGPAFARRPPECPCPRAGEAPVDTFASRASAQPWAALAGPAPCTPRRGCRACRSPPGTRPDQLAQPRQSAPPAIATFWQKPGRPDRYLVLEAAAAWPR